MSESGLSGSVGAWVATEILWMSKERPFYPSQTIIHRIIWLFDDLGDLIILGDREGGARDFRFTNLDFRMG